VLRETSIRMSDNKYTGKIFSAAVILSLLVGAFVLATLPISEADARVKATGCPRQSPEGQDTTDPVNEHGCGPDKRAIVK
jgi:hypothetical protein